MNRSEALAFFDAAYRRGVAWVEAMLKRLARMEFRQSECTRNFRLCEVSALDILELERDIQAARDMHRETMAMIAWEVCGPAFAEAEAEARRIAGAIVEARREGVE
jgi:hypothetical protein